MVNGRRAMVSGWVAWWSAAMFAAAPASAQVNAEVLRANPFRAGWSGGVDASLALARGNVELLDVGGAGRLQFQTLHPPSATDGAPFVRQRVFVTTSGRFAESAGVDFVSQAFTHGRWIAMWHRRVGTDLFAQFQYNEFFRLNGRAVVGGGVRVEAVHSPRFMLWGGSGYMFEYDRIRVRPGATDAPESWEHRWTSYASARFATFDGRLLLQNTVYVQPRFDALGDVRVLEEFEVLSKVTEVFGLGLTTSLLYDSAPPTGVRTVDLRLATTIRLSL